MPTPPIPRELLADTAAAWQIPLSSAQVDQFERYAAELVRWNTATNLTTITEPHAIVVRHFLDSLALARAWPAAPPSSLADIGAGAGFPGLPLKILWHDLHVLLVESVGKKTEFLRHVVDQLELEDVAIETMRAEALGHDPRYREQFGAVTGRAVAALNVLAEYCLPLCAVGGQFIAPKSPSGLDEAQAAHHAVHVLGGEFLPPLEIQLPEIEARTLIVVRKVQNTPAQYPRRTGVPTKRPL